MGGTKLKGVPGLMPRRLKWFSKLSRVRYPEGSSRIRCGCPGMWCKLWCWNFNASRLMPNGLRTGPSNLLPTRSCLEACLDIILKQCIDHLCLLRERHNSSVQDGPSVMTRLMDKSQVQCSSRDWRSHPTSPSYGHLLPRPTTSPTDDRYIYRRKD